MVIDVLEPLSQVIRLGAVLDAADEEAYEPGQRVLIHGVNASHVADAEEQDGVIGTPGLVASAGIINLLLSLLCNDLLVLDLIGDDLGLRQDLDGTCVLEDVALKVTRV